MNFVFAICESCSFKNSLPGGCPLRFAGWAYEISGSNEVGLTSLVSKWAEKLSPTLFNSRVRSDQPSGPIQFRQLYLQQTCNDPKYPQSLPTSASSKRTKTSLLIFVITLIGQKVQKFKTFYLLRFTSHQTSHILHIEFTQTPRI